MKDMKHTLLLIASGALLLTACHGTPKAPQLVTRQDTLSWVLGENIGLSLRQMQGTLNLDNEMVQRAVEYTLADGEQPLSDSLYIELLNQLILTQQTETLRRENQQQAQIDQQQEDFFAQLTKEHPGVKKHESGFYYEQVKAGKGRNAKLGDRVSFDYRSFLMFTGQPYDQTYGKRDPILHVVGRPMFQGLIDGIQLMNAGSIYRFYFPYQLAFGPQGSGDIPGFTPFIYEVEVHEIL